MSDFSLLREFCSDNEIEFELSKSMSLYTSFRLGRTADIVVFPKSIEEIRSIVSLCKKNLYEYFIIGKGTNLLFKDDGEAFAAICMTKFCSVSLSDENEITADAGASLGNVCSLALNNSLAGAEFAFGIPGSVGGALYMNAGAFGGEIKDIVVKADVLDELGNIKTLTKEEMSLGYRKSLFQNDKYVILRAVFKLSNGDQGEIKSKMDEILSKRKEKQPLDYPSAGSTFKRPDGAFAAELIDRCGLKGHRVGGAMVSEKHAGFIINIGNATSKDILDLIEFVKQTVKKETGYTLEPEVIILR